MIWFFLAGMIAGAVGVIMVLMWWIRTHAIKVTPEQMMKDIEESNGHIFDVRDAKKDETEW